MRFLLLAGVMVAGLVAAPASAQAPTCFGAAATITGTTGDDVLQGTEGDDVIAGLSGVDQIEGLGGGDKICGDEGVDLIFPGPGEDEVGGGPNRDAVSYFGAAGGVVVDLASGSATGEGRDEIVGVEVVEGSREDDVITGSTGADCLLGSGGADLLRGAGGDDVLFGDDPGFERLTGEGCFSDALGFAMRRYTSTAAGDDVLIGGSGGDVLFGLGGGDSMRGGGGHCAPGIDCLDTVDYGTAPRSVTVDLVKGTARGEGRDRLTGMESIAGSRFDDVLRANGASNFVFGGNGDDSLMGRGGPDRVDGGPGTNRIDGGPHGDGSDYVLYNFQPGPATVDMGRGVGRGEGVDRFEGIEAVWGSDADDLIFGDGRANILNGEGGSDAISGGGGLDLISPGAGDDSVDGGGGSDIASFEDAGAGVEVDLVRGSATGAGTDTITEVEGVVGTPFDDTIAGSGMDEILWGLTGNDALDGGGGVDFSVYALAEGPVDVDLAAGAATGADGSDALEAIEGAVGTSFDDDLAGDADSNSFDGGAGDDRIAGAGGDDYFFGGPGDDRIEGGEGTFDVVDYFYTPGPVSADLARQRARGEGRDTLAGIEGVVGSDGRDELVGSAGPDYLAGEEGADRILAGAGADRLVGDRGRDLLSGQAGQDDCFGGEDNRSCERFREPDAPPLQKVSRRARHRRARHP